MQLKFKILLVFLLAFIISLNSCVNEFKPTTNVTLSPIDTSFFHNFTSVHISISGVYNYLENGYQPKRDTGFILPVPGGYSFYHFLPDVSILWNGYNFIMVNNQTDRHGTSDSWVDYFESWHYAGSLSDSGLKISGQGYHYLHNLAYDYHPGIYENDIEQQYISYDSIPLVSKSSDSIVFSLSGTALKSRISSVSDSIGYFYKSSQLSGIIWDAQPAPILTIKFYK